MASTGKKGKKNKGKPVPLNDFLSSSSISWSDQVDEADKLGEFARKSALPAAPRAARGIEIDDSRIPKNPPFVAYLSNLSYELEESDIIHAFLDLTISTVRLPRDDHSGRLKGFGYIEFDDRASLIAALQKREATIRGRRIKIDVAENERRGGMRDNRERQPNYDSDRTTGDWRTGPRSEFQSSDDRRGPMSSRKEYSGFRDGYDKSRGDRDSGWRDGERRFGGDRDSRSNYGGRRNYDDSESNYSEPKTRAKLNLKPRSIPIENATDEPPKKEESRTEPEKPPTASIFGKAKPVDTAAREREIEKRLEKEKEGGKTEKDFDNMKSKNSDESSSDAKSFRPAPEPKENVWVRKSMRTEAENTSKEPVSGETEEPEKPASESDKDQPEYPDDSSRYGDSKRNDHYESDRDSDSRYNRSNRNDNRYNDRNRDNDRGYGRKEDRWKDEKDRRDRRDYDRRDKGYDNDRRSGGRSRDQDRDGSSRRYSEREGDQKRFSNDRESDWRKNADKEGDNKRFQDREAGRHRDQEENGNNKAPRGDRRSGPPSGDKGSRPVKTTQERERGPQNKDKPREQKDGLRMPKVKESSAPNYIGTNKYSFLEEDGVSE